MEKTGKFLNILIGFIVMGFVMLIFGLSVGAVGGNLGVYGGALLIALMVTFAVKTIVSQRS